VDLASAGRGGEGLPRVEISTRGSSPGYHATPSAMTEKRGKTGVGEKRDLSPFLLPSNWRPCAANRSCRRRTTSGRLIEAAPNGILVPQRAGIRGLVARWRKAGLRLVLQFRLKVAEQILRAVFHSVFGQAHVLLVLPNLPAGQKQVLGCIFHLVLVPPKLMLCLELLHKHLGKGEQVIRRVMLFGHPPSFPGSQGPYLTDPREDVANRH
jgi:hypothetical protein